MKAQLLEALASIEHERWAHWQKYVHSLLSTIHDTESGSPLYYTINLAQIEHWERQINTEYEDLSEREKDSDREQVMRYLPLIVEAFAQWLEQQGRADEEMWNLADRFREEMR